MFFKILGSGEPSRLLVAGVHGNEGALTEPVLKLFAEDIEVRHGRLIISGLPGGQPYLSTLDKAYYDSETGKKLLEQIRMYRPRIYLELHSYAVENYSKLTDPKRKNKIGVPPLTELEERVLIGSVSPLIRITEFSMHDFCFVLEVPSPQTEEALHVALDVLGIIALADSRDEILSKLRDKYPEQIRRAEKHFREFFREVRRGKPSFF